MDAILDSVLTWFRKTQGNIKTFNDLGFDDPQTKAITTVSTWNYTLSDNTTAIPIVPDSKASLVKDAMIFVTIAALYSVIGLVIFIMDRMGRESTQEPDEEQRIDRSPDVGLTRHWLTEEETDKDEGSSLCPTSGKSWVSNTDHSQDGQLVDGSEECVP